MRYSVTNSSTIRADIAVFRKLACENCYVYHGEDITSNIERNAPFQAYFYGALPYCAISWNLTGNLVTITYYDRCA